MKASLLESMYAPLEEDLAARMASLFDQCPQLHGFTVQDVSALPVELRPGDGEDALVVTDMGVFPFINSQQCETIYNEIAVTLTDFLSERPSAKAALRGRTFARSLH